MATSHVWTIVLGGGARERRAAARTGDAHRAGRPTRHLLFRRAVERAARLADPGRVVAVLDRDRAPSYALVLDDLPEVERLVQPLYRGTAPEVFLPVLRIVHRDPQATVLLLPGDQVVEGEARLAAALMRAIEAVQLKPELPLIIGVHPTRPDCRGGWLEPGPPVEELRAFGVRSVARFVAHPAPAELAALFEGDGLVNTRIVVARARTLVALGRRYLPDVLETFEPLAGAFGTPEEPLLCEAVYEGMPYASLAHALFVRAEHTAVLPVPHGTTWTERGAPLVERLAS